MAGVLVNNVLQRMRKDTVVVEFKFQSQRLPGGRNHETPVLRVDGDL